jgi:hypothetical protein
LAVVAGVMLARWLRPKTAATSSQTGRESAPGRE